MRSSRNKKVVILGGGFAGVHTYRNLIKKLNGEITVDIVMVNNTNHFVFTPLLHEVATGGIDARHIAEPIRKIAPQLHSFFCAEVQRISLHEKKVYTTAGVIDYDYLAIATGSTTNFFGVAGAERFALTLKTLKDARRLKNRCIDLFEIAAHEESEAQLKKLLSFAVVGGGPTGVELVAELSEFLHGALANVYPARLKKYISVTIIQGASELVPMFPQTFRDVAIKTLLKKGIKVRCNSKVLEIQEGGAILTSGEKLSSSSIIWTAGIKPSVPIFDQPVESARNGRLKVDGELRLIGHDDVYALGDVASFGDLPLPTLAQVAVGQAEAVALSVVGKITTAPKSPRVFRYTSKGTLMSIGHFMALMDIRGYVFKGPIVWFLWRAIYLSKMYSGRKRISVLVDWTLDLFTGRDITEV
ncbi:MAG: NAD(P)/FAD-dependent oxidoreductase [bacterium]|nr:NAD(P)/FAD-dependent oxidoreductase [bacterium]